ncbi:C-terminal binding protein [Halomonas sp. ANAO-440]|uniref:C-terminal binding protein n=1 Tax=Halomonas sp. ANAO-440 TaxID=2861360 RepID=UPI001CAA580C|nr:C-terminal binding protein [Halomonas sp. ANAO-440]MBZ0332535.1 C-terminal binding protein [Halomonas sp. ANAO-440]
MLYKNNRNEKRDNIVNPSVLMTDTIFPDTLVEQDVFQKESIDFRLSPSGELASLGELGKDADALLVVYADVSAELIEQLDRCKIIVKAGIGYNNIDVEAASRKGIIVANVPDYCQDEVADHTFGMFLALVRKICHLDSQVKQGVWNANQAKSVPQLRGKKFGLLGCGAIGQQVALRARAFGLEVVGYDPYSSPDLLAQHHISQIEDFDEFLHEVDFLSLHLPLTEDTRHILNKSTLSKMKETSVVINTSRGGLIQENDLFTALIEGRLAGAAMDVLEKEPPEGAPELSSLDNVVITPHTAFLSQDSVAALRKKASQEIVRTIRNGKASNPVN